MLIPKESDVIRICQGEISQLMGIYVYGSYAIGRTHSESDLDLALIADKPIDLKKLYQLSLGLANFLNLPKVDIIDMRSAPLTLAAEVLRDGKLILDNNSYEIASWEVTLMSMYANFNEERKEIIEDIVKRGSVYGR